MAQGGLLRTPSPHAACGSQRPLKVWVPGARGSLARLQQLTHNAIHNIVHRRVCAWRTPTTPVHRRHLPGQIVETAQAVDDLMSSDFLERTRFSAAAAVTDGILDRLRLQAGLRVAGG